MKSIGPLVLALAAIATAVQAEPLTVPEREALLDQLDALREKAQETGSSKLKIAINAYREAVGSNDAALTLYENCVEKLQFEDQNRSSQDFREWRRRNSDRHRSDEFRSALRFQLRWLLLTLRASTLEGDLSELRPEVIDYLEAAFAASDMLRSQREILQQGVLGSVFARAYDIEKTEVENWPRSPFPLAPVFEQVIFPPLRAERDYGGLRTAWTRMIQLEGRLLEEMSGPEPKPSDPPPPEFTRFITETRPEMIWAMEEDLFKAGDERGAAMQMLKHISAHITHQRAVEWEERFRGLVNPEPAEEISERE